mmetsp:Transcript_61053/g.189660  ORF Transcript_61053/g.189660 Transcript_61053/m.189660 type:complete len:221 (+) Transcript_61053:62-724(+)
MRGAGPVSQCHASPRGAAVPAAGSVSAQAVAAANGANGARQISSDRPNASLGAGTSAPWTTSACVLVTGVSPMKCCSVGLGVRGVGWTQESLSSLKGSSSHSHSSSSKSSSAMRNCMSFWILDRFDLGFRHFFWRVATPISRSWTCCCEAVGFLCLARSASRTFDLMGSVFICVKASVSDRKTADARTTMARHVAAGPTRKSGTTAWPAAPLPRASMNSG